MSDESSHGADDFRQHHLRKISNIITGASSSSQNSESTDALHSRRFASAANGIGKETQYTLLLLVEMVRESSILYDAELQATVPESQLKRQKREAWNRIRAEIMWQDMTPVQDIWADLLDQYMTKSSDMSDTFVEAMRWIDPHISKKKVDSRPSSQMNNMSSSLDKDYFGDVPLSEDVLVSGPSLESPNSSLGLCRDYVVIQPSRRSGELDVDHSRPSSSSIPSSSTQYSRRKPSPSETDDVRTYPLSSKASSSRQHHSDAKTVKGQLQAVKKEYKDDGHQLNFGRTGVLVEVEHGYTPSNQKVYKLVAPTRTTPPQATATITSGRRLVGRFQVHRGSSFGYDSVPPESLIDSSDPGEPPQKKKVVDDLRHHRTVSIVGTSPSKVRVVDPSVSIIRSSDKMVSDGVPLVDEEIILDGETECKPMVGSDLLISRHSARSAGQLASSSHDTSADDLHHYHHEEIEDGTVVEEELEQQVIVDQGDGMPMDSMQSIQYDEDLAFQQHINGVLNRLNDDDKAMMKFNMQKIILDARFGAGTARNMLKEDELLVVQDEHVVIDPVESSSQL